jgi:hypothetical protein
MEARPEAFPIKANDYASEWIAGSELFSNFQPTVPIRAAARSVVCLVLVSAGGTGKFLNDRRHRRSTESGNLLAFEDQPKPVGDVVAMRQSGRRSINT